MGIKNISFYQLSVGPDRTVEVEPFAIRFNPALERWAFSVALTRIALPSNSQFAQPSIAAAAASVILTSDRSTAPVYATHGTSEEYGRLTALQFAVVADYGITVDALLTLYEYETEFERAGEIGRVGGIEKPTNRGPFGG